MAFADLNTEMQTLILFNFEFFAKFLLVVGLIFYAFTSIKNFDVNKKEVYFATRIFKGINYITSKVIVYLCPLFIFLLFPQVSLDKLLIILASIYAVLIPLFMMVILPINVTLYGAGYMSDFLGMKGTKVQKIRDEWNKISSGGKLGK